MTDHAQAHGVPTPVAIAAFEGWNDAADASTAAVDHLEQLWHAREVAEVEPEEYYDFQVNRPHISLLEGVSRHIEWPTTKVLMARPFGAKRQVALIRGIEPSMRWRAFCRELLGICAELKVEQLVLLGALLADVPYNRPLPISGSISHPGTTGDPAGDAPADDPPAEMQRLRITPTRYDGPTGIVGVLHDEARNAGLHTMSFWVHVPHYANNPPCPKATLALLHRIEEVLDLPVPLAELAEESAEWEARVKVAATQDAELAEYLRELEERAGDAELKPPSGDEIASHFEKYLRRRGSAG